MHVACNAYTYADDGQTSAGRQKGRNTHIYKHIFTDGIKSAWAHGSNAANAQTPER